MTAKLADIAGLPFWPRFLSREQAAAYLGVSASTFDEEVTAGIWPPGVRRGAREGRITWDRVALDRAVDNGPFASMNQTAEDDDYERRRAAHEAKRHKHRQAHAR
ncbi:helix-turn-helix transcriptional regulator [Azospirillum sp.]|uniref:helix-turn-helix transcriptional regulator n=1 Tax=Azospirillum sp. TaxID=34012 RepID=UPI003D72FFEB